MIKKTTLFFTGLLLLLPTWLWAQSVGPDIKHQRQAGSASGQLKQPIGPRSAVILPQLRRNHAPQPITLGPPAPVPQLKLDQYQRGPEGPTFLSLVMSPDLIQQTKSLPANEQAARTSLHYLRQNGFPSLPSELELMSEQTDAQGIRHVRFQQTAQGIEVYGADLWVHLYPDQRLIVNGRYQPQPAASLLVPSITGAEALEAAQVHFQQHQEIHALPFGWKKFLGYETVPTKLVVYMEKGYLRRQRLVYQVTLRPNVIERHELFVDAHTGEVIHEFDHTCSIAVTGTAQDLNGVNRTINLWRDGANYYAIDASRTPMYTGNGTTFPTEGEGVILTLDMNNTSGNNPNITYATSGNPNNWAPKVVSAHFNSGEAFEYFKQKFGRNAINGS
ncbi:MAG: PepSY domain-containing protein, partial [Bacteroidota bacterium]